MTMKVRSLALILAFVLVMGPAAVALANSNPFSDVPADHWAYDAVIQLAAVGLVEGYPDGTYGGTRMMTRYEAALVFARTLARLEALVEEEVYATNADLRAQVVAEVLADIEAAKAELAALIKDELAKIEVPVVEHTIERVVVEQPIEKIVEVQPVERPFQLTPEAQNIISKLVADLFKQELEAAELGAQEVIVETRILERIVEAEDALTEEDVNRIVEAILAAEFERVSREHAQSQAEIDKAHAELAAAHAELAAAQADLDARVEAILKRINALESGQASLVAGQDALAAEVAELAAAADEEQARVAGLISGLQADVNGLEKALVGEIDRVMNAIYALNDEFKTELALLGVRVDTLEKLFISLEDRISGVEGRVALVEQEQVSLRKDLERVQLSGKLTFDASSEHTKIEDTVTDYFGTEYKHAALGLTQKGELKLTVKASDRVTVGAFTKYAVDIFNTQNIDFSEYRVEV
ncbi:MAG: S-layer homology domain-containing protein, partial [Firmicutes bacterium]|nr:S-layer homology domain-containing protein [Bacillota bacterium]